MTSPDPRLARLKKKTESMMKQEADAQIAAVRNREDYTPGLEPFLRTLEQTLFLPEYIAQAQRQVVLTTCVQAPLELFFAAGVQPFRLACGSHATTNMAPRHFSALTCPMIKSMAGFLEQHKASTPARTAIPLTCDWAVKFNELTDLDQQTKIHFLELPRLRESERASQRWINEIKMLKSWLEEITGQKIASRKLQKAINTYARAFDLFTRLIDHRRRRDIPCVHFALVTNALPFMDIDQWMDYTSEYILGLKTAETKAPPVYLAGSPVAFPNYKMLDLIEKAGMTVIADDICTMERVLPGAVTYEDRSEYALLKALAQRHHVGCTCPTFADNQRRLNTMMRVLEQHNIQGIIFHVLKGCHPYDMEAGILENRLKETNYRFLKVETDYVKEDEQNIITRLDAFKRTLRSDP